MSDHAVSAPTGSNDAVIAATSAQLQVDGKRHDSNNIKHGCKPSVETERDSKKNQTEQPPRFLERERSEAVMANSAAESGPKDYISEESENSLWASIREYLNSTQCSGHAHGWTKVE